jgi:cytidylate kinase
MSEQRRPDDEGTAPSDPGLQTPRHGFQGNRTPQPLPSVPAAVSIAVSREAGARGGTIGRRVGRKLGWQVYDQEVLEYMAQEGTVRQELLDTQEAAAGRWAEEQLRQLRRQGKVAVTPPLLDLARVILALGGQGRVVFIGRGAGCVLPAASTLKVRILAPLDDRIAYMSQWLRLTRDEAAERVRLRDRRRAEYLQTHFHSDPNDVYQYDLVLNSSLLGEEVSAELIVQAAEAKWVLLDGERDQP